MNSRGFTLIELVVGMVLTAIVSTAIMTVLVNSQRLYMQQTQRVKVTDNVRSAMSVLPGEIRELNAGDPAGSDIITMTSTSLRYKAMRNLYVTCRAGVTGTQQLVLQPTSLGLRPLDPTRDSALVFVDADSTTDDDDQWLHLDLVSASAGAACPGGAPSLTITVNAGPDLGGVTAWSPARSFEIVEVQLYEDAAGSWWLGGHGFDKSTGTWDGLQQVAGPLTASGLTFSYFDAAGGAAATVDEVTRVGIALTGRSGQRVRTPLGSTAYLLDSMTTQVALRNNP
jgi:prepilin-type N-terminal cleavage/methylation domain-containing protein